MKYLNELKKHYGVKTKQEAEDMFYKLRAYISKKYALINESIDLLPCSSDPRASNLRYKFMISRLNGNTWERVICYSWDKLDDINVLINGLITKQNSLRA